MTSRSSGVHALTMIVAGMVLLWIWTRFAELWLPSVAFYAGVVVFLTGLVSVLVPLRFVGVRTRGGAVLVALAGAAIAAVALLWPVGAGGQSAGGATALDQVLPEYDRGERHEIRVQGSVEQVRKAVDERHIRRHSRVPDADVVAGAEAGDGASQPGTGNHDGAARRVYATGKSERRIRGREHRQAVGKCAPNCGRRRRGIPLLSGRRVRQDRVQHACGSGGAWLVQGEHGDPDSRHGPGRPDGIHALLARGLSGERADEGDVAGCHRAAAALLDRAEIHY